MLDDRYAGCVDGITDGVVGGWAIDRNEPLSPCRVDIYVNARRVDSRLADNERKDLSAVSPGYLRKGFSFDLKSTYRDGDRIEAYFGGTNIRIPVGRHAGKLRRYRIDPEQFYLAASPFVPVPDDAMIEHVGGRTKDNPRASYVFIGATVAADIYNVLSEAGCDLGEPGFHLVDLGCGCGRIASFMAPFLSEGKYTGFDVWSEGVSWAREHLSKAVPDMTFSALTAEEGGYQGQKYFTLPIPGGSIDAVTSNSLFTHLDQATTTGYIAEIGRVLKPRGVVYLSCLFRDPEALKIMAAKHQRGLKFVEEPAVSYWHHDGYLDSCIDLDFLTRRIEENGMQVILTRKGSWRGLHESAATFAASQDLLAARKV